MDANKDGVVTIEELVQWCSKDEQLLRSLDTLDTVLWEFNILSEISVSDYQIRFEQWLWNIMNLFIDLFYFGFIDERNT